MQEIDFNAVICETVQSMSKVHTQNEFKEVCNEFVHRVGLNYFMFSSCRAGSLTTPDMMMIDNFPNGWCEYYKQHGLVRVDPITAYCFSNTLPVLWHQLIQRPEYSESCHRMVIKAAARYDLVSGLTIPVRAPSGEFSMLSLVSNRPADQMEVLLQTLIPYAQFLAGNMLNVVFRNQWLDKGIGENSKQLTKREEECMFWACEGKTSWEIAKILDINERTVRFHINNITKKLGVSTRQQAVAKVLLLNVIKPRLTYAV